MTETQRKVKRLFDFVFGLFLFIISLLLILPFGLAVKLQDGGPIFSKHIRAGKDNRLFVMYKLRTRKKADLKPLNLQLSSAHWLNCVPDNFTYDKDSQTIDSVTKIGRFLRRSRLDELPQLWNVIIGNMSLVGPRPELREIADHYNDTQLKRLSMKPGMTGLAQVTGNCRMAYGDKIKLDQAYAEHYSLMLDLKILLQTFFIPWKSFPQPANRAKTI